MRLKGFLSKPLAKYLLKKQDRWASDPIRAQNAVLKHLVSVGSKTSFGADHQLSDVHDYTAFKKAVPVRDYEGLKPYVDRILAGDSDVLWKGRPTYFSKTSGTTSGMKFIPITKDSMPYHINAARDALLNYVRETGKSSFFDKNMMFLSGSPAMEMKGGIHYGRLSGIVNHHVPGVLKGNQLPTYDTNCIEDWESKLEHIIKETIDKPMSLISGIPPWVQMYFDRIVERTGKPIKDVFPEFELFVYGGVNIAPYRDKLFDSIGKEIPSIETYPASEGFIAYQDTQTEEGLLLLVDGGIFYEFIPVEEFYSENPTRISLEDVQLGVNYVIILNTNAGLWGYNIGDTVKFVSVTPFRLLVTGRIKHFISAFGEHVIGEEVERAMKCACGKYPEVRVVEFTVAPSVNPEKGASRHEWYVEFERGPDSIDAFSRTLDQELTRINGYYDDLIRGNILQSLIIKPLKRASFIDFMKSQGKLGGQNKVPRLSNDRKIAEVLERYVYE